MEYFLCVNRYYYYYYYYRIRSVVFCFTLDEPRIKRMKSHRSSTFQLGSLFLVPVSMSGVAFL